jgi:hypothetical protein
MNRKIIPMISKTPETSKKEFKSPNPIRSTARKTWPQTNNPILPYFLSKIMENKQATRNTKAMIKV